MTWHLTENAILNYQHARRWSIDDSDRARRELAELAEHATYRDHHGHLERWRSPKRHGGLRWLIDARSQSVVWVGYGAPPIAHFLDGRH